MALTSTPYKITLDISDMDRDVYESVKVTVARHPSQTELRLSARVLAFALFYHEHQALAATISRNTHWGVMVTDGVVYVSNGDEQIELKLIPLR